MAMDWIKVTKELHRSRKVKRLQHELMIRSADQVVGLVVRFWSWCDSETDDGVLELVTPGMIDDVMQVDGFAEAMQLVGWLAWDGTQVIVPNFDKHMSESAKKRAQAMQRQRRKRSGQFGSNHVTQLSRSQRDESVTREEKRREEKKEGSIS